MKKLTKLAAMAAALCLGAALLAGCSGSNENSEYAVFTGDDAPTMVMGLDRKSVV